MHPTFNPSLINGPFDDAGLFVDFVFDCRALLFDLGDLAALAPKKLLRVSDVFVSHTHMDHFIGFDQLLRICLGRERRLRMYGPPGFIDQVAHKLGGYTWNLVDRYPTDFTIEAWELHPDDTMEGAEFHCRAQFAAEPLGRREAGEGVLLNDRAFRVRAAALDHQTTSLAFTLEEKVHINVWKNRLDEMGLPTGPWLKDLKDAAAQDVPRHTPIRAWWRDQAGLHERHFTFGELSDRVLRRVPGQKVCYVTDVVFHEANLARIAALAQGADVMYIECTFLDEDRAQAAHKFHLTARQAGEIARTAGVRAVEPFHFSPRYAEREAELRAELQAAFSG